MAVYKAKENTYIGGVYYEEGQLITVADNFPIGYHLEPVDDAAKKAAKAAISGGLIAVDDEGEIIKVDPLDKLMMTATADEALKNSGSK